MSNRLYMQLVNGKGENAVSPELEVVQASGESWELRVFDDSDLLVLFLGDPGDELFEKVRGQLASDPLGLLEDLYDGKYEDEDITGELDSVMMGIARERAVDVCGRWYTADELAALHAEAGA